MRGFSIFFLLILIAGQAHALEILYPVDKSWVKTSDIFVVKCGEPASEALVLSINGVETDPIVISSDAYRQAYGDYLIVKPEYDPGRNIVEVQGITEGKTVATVRIDIYFKPDGPPPRGSSYVDFVMHRPEREAGCIDCHEMNPDAASYGIEDPQSNLCADCHRRLVQNTYGHPPAVRFQCVHCHERNSEPARYAVREPVEKLCASCHQDQVGRFRGRAFQHEPFYGGGCDHCHNPHGSEQPDLLRKPVNRLCESCHAEVGKQVHVAQRPSGGGHPLEGGRDPLDPSRPFSCVSCHDPHGGDVRYFFPAGAASAFELCVKCHQK